ncbi:MAG: hypothetical protein DIU71_00420 [Proteobacteria bacterium]|nr:MAG: hypothetical protein DIU71_00420 [Pseudomonadota bacterium]
MDMRQVDPATVRVWRWLTASLAIPPGIGAMVAVFTDGGPWAVLPGAVAAAALALAWVWPPLYYRHLRWRLDSTGIVIRRGVLWQSWIALPRTRIQHSDVYQGPLQRRFGVGTLKLYTAGTRHTRIELPGLAHADALKLRDALLAEDDGRGA